MTEMNEITPEHTVENKAILRKQRWIIAVIIVTIVLVIVGMGFAIFALVQNPAVASNVRDIFIILMAFESLLIGAALVVLVIQMVSLVNLLQNEVKPILESTSITVNTLRGTTEFLSENLVDPVIKLNSYLAGLRKLFALFGIKK